ncbi:hypothetical protein GGF41_005484, partial [Coemansia sp. RSA 2531]
SLLLLLHHKLPNTRRHTIRWVIVLTATRWRRWNCLQTLLILKLRRLLHRLFRELLLLPLSNNSIKAELRLRL